MIERTDPRAALDEVVTLVTERLPTHFGVDPLTDIQVFAPVYRGALGIDALNTRLREALNPRGRPVLGGRLRIGDKLMLSGRNLHDLGLMNGTILRLLEHNEDAEALVVEADGAIFHLPEEEAPKLQLAYACSIHKGQGIELPVAIVIAHAAAGAYFLRREMLYTAMTRARKATLIVGQRAIVARAAATPDTSRRYSRPWRPVVERLPTAGRCRIVARFVRLPARRRGTAPRTPGFSLGVQCMRKNIRLCKVLPGRTPSAQARGTSSERSAPDPSAAQTHADSSNFSATGVLWKQIGSPSRSPVRSSKR